MEDLQMKGLVEPIKKKEEVTAEAVVDGYDPVQEKHNLQIYDVVLAGVEN